MPSPRRPGPVLVVLLALAFGTPSLRAELLRHELAAAVLELKARMPEQPDGGRAISLGPITGEGPDGSRITGGARVRLVLVEELRRAGITVRAGAPALKGSIRPAAASYPGAEVRLELAGSEPIERTVLSERLAWELFGPSVVLPATPARADRLREALAAPATTVKAGRALAGPDSPVAVEILLDDKAVPARRDGPHAVVPAARGQRLTVRVINRSDSDLAVTLTFNGIHVFAFTPPAAENPAYTPPTSRVRKDHQLDLTDWAPETPQAEPFLVGRAPARAPAAFAGLLGGEVTTVTLAVKPVAAAPAGGPADGELKFRTRPISEIISLRILHPGAAR